MPQYFASTREGWCRYFVASTRLVIFSCPSGMVALMSARRPIPEAELDALQRETFEYFVREANPTNGLIVDKAEANSLASIAAIGRRLPLTRSASSADFGRAASRWSVR